MHLIKYSFNNALLKEYFMYIVPAASSYWLEWANMAAIHLGDIISGSLKHIKI